ncbi:grasp-with-spasm system ATP-grasp peptide maturase [Yeosuana sp.]|uniref:grasp-with-spasm system ATP-grasp peptide maturase n=1 Tax=Yeosuana sp. TaxID=2529388 RepID=UPI004054CB7C
MVLIFSITNDQSTTEITRWLHFYGVNEVIRLNADEPNFDFHSYSENPKSINIIYKENIINILNNKVSWYRKGKALFKNILLKKREDYVFQDEDQHLNDTLKSDLIVFSSYLYSLIENTGYSLGKHNNSSLNKLMTLQKAREIGLKTPVSYVVKDKEGLLKIINCHEEVITKAMSDGVYLFNQGMAYYTYTEKIDEKGLDALPNTFFPSLVQDLVEKEYEIRVFYLEGKFYSMAILSQSDESTSVDFRKYNDEKPNRNVPYKLPEDVKIKLKNLFDLLNLNTGSADLIKNLKGEYIFLEINPVGQFAMVSYPCNYYLEEKIANQLYSKWKNLN